MSEVTIYLKDYQPATFLIKSVNLVFDLHEDDVLVTNCMVLKRQFAGELRLYGDDLELISVTLNDKELTADQYLLDGDDLVLSHCPDELTLTIVTRNVPQNNTALSGLYRSGDLFCTQCEAEGFRRITFFLDRPDILTLFTTKIIADAEKYPILLSNGNLIDSASTADGRHWAIWQDPYPKPSYLFALVAGNLYCIADEFITMSGKHVALRLYVDPGQENQCSHAISSLKKAMRWDEIEYGREYDLDIFMMVAVSAFNMGAMENKGLNIFNAACILASPETATDNDYMRIESVIAHEYFHNWTGNRVTCRDWFQLSLKEGLTVFRDQEFSADQLSRDLQRIIQVNTLQNRQFPEDASSMAHPVRPQSYEEISNFYTATIYEKGAEVIRMQHTLLGKAGFRRGMDLYFARHDGQAVTIDDFVSAMEDANEVDLTQFKLWYSQIGTPVVRVTHNYSAGQLALTFTQVDSKTSDQQPLHIPIKVALFTEQGQPIELAQDLFELREQTHTFQISNISRKPIVSLLRDFSAPIVLQTDIDEQDWLQILQVETNGFCKWNAAKHLAIENIVRCYQTQANTWFVSEILIDAYRHILLDDSLDAGLRAKILTPPDFEELVACLPEVDVSKLESARDFFREQVSVGLMRAACTYYRELWEQEDHTMQSSAYARRALRNVCLSLMMRCSPETATSVCKQQFLMAKTMTDQLASLVLLVNCGNQDDAHEALESFYARWHKHELVVDKWFSIQASCERKNTLKVVQSLITHEAFSLKNPNKVRALIGGFCQANPRNFHALDGSGYEFLQTMLVTIDALNPQLASRLALPFTRWKSLDSARQSLIKQQLENLNAQSLSTDLRELVTKSLTEKSYNVIGGS